MKQWMIVLFFLAGCASLWADDKGYDAMKEFIHQEDERLKDIKLLSLDLEKADLEFKRKEIQSKMAGLSGVSVSDKTIPVSDDQPDIRVSGIVIKEDVKHAFLNIDGRVLYAAEGEEIANKIKIVEITDKFVSVAYPDGKTRQLGLR